MLNAAMDNASECPISDIPVSDQKHAMQLGITFNGIQFVYRDFKYDRLADAINYAELETERALKPAVPSTPIDWRQRPVPSVADLVLMKEHSITFEGGRYKYQDYRYDRLADALNYAQSNRS